MVKLVKNAQKARKDLDPLKVYKIDEALALVKGRAYAKFDETLEIAINLNVDPRNADQNIRGMVQLPAGTGKSVRVAVFAKGEKVLDAEKAGADLVGGEDLADKIISGQINFDRCISTPDMMSVVGKLGKVLGPKGLMPNPKLGTVTNDVAKAVKAAKSGQIEYRTDKTGIVHGGIGKLSFSPEQLLSNVRAYLAAIMAAKPTSVKGLYIKKVSISSTMGPSFTIDVSELSGFASKGSE